MKRRTHISFVCFYSLVSYFYSCTAFYLPGLAPVSFCDESSAGEDCQVRINQISEKVSTSRIMLNLIFLEVAYGFKFTDFPKLAS